MPQSSSSRISQQITYIPSSSASIHVARVTGCSFLIKCIKDPSDNFNDLDYFILAVNDLIHLISVCSLHSHNRHFTWCEPATIYPMFNRTSSVCFHRHRSVTRSQTFTVFYGLWINKLSLYRKYIIALANYASPGQFIYSSKNSNLIWLLR